MIHSYKRAPASLSCSHVFADSRDVSCQSEIGAPVDVCSLMPTRRSSLFLAPRPILNVSINLMLNLRLDSAVIHPSEYVRDLGVQLNSHLAMRDPIAKIASPCFYHLRRFRQLRRLADQPMLQRLVSAFVLSRIDYCNSVLDELPHTTLAPLQRALHAAVRLVAGLGPRDHVTDSMKALHWLPVPYRIKLKLCVLMHAVVIRTSPVYIKVLLAPTKDIAGCFNLRSTAAGDFSVARFRLEFGRRAFSVAGPMEWSALPA